MHRILDWFFGSPAVDRTGVPRTSRPLIWAVIFVAGLALLELVFLGPDPDRRILARHLALGNYGRLAIVLILSLASLALTTYFCYLAFAASRPVRVFYSLIFLLFVAVEYGHHLAYNRFSTFGTAVILYFAGGWQFVGNAAVMYFNVLCLVPAFVFLILSIFIRPQPSVGGKRVLVLAGTVLLFFSASAFFYPQYLQHDLVRGRNADADRLSGGVDVWTDRRTFARKAIQPASYCGRTREV